MPYASAEKRREYMRVYGSKYKASNREKIVVQDAAYRATHKKEAHEQYVSRREKVIARATAWNQAHPDLRRAIKSKSNEAHPDEMRASFRKHSAKHRLLGYVPLNAPFVGCEGHHVDNEQVINMPKALHRSVYHRQSDGRGMAQINAIAYNFLFKQEVEAALEDKREQLA